VGSILLPLFLVLVHSPVLFGWAKPVPFNPAYFRDPKKGIMIVGAAGPLTNLALAVLAGLIVRVSGVGGVLGYFLLSACIINVALGVFNLIPIPPLDGSRVVMGLLPWSALSFYLRLERYGVFIVFALLWIGVLDYVVRPVTLGLVRLLIGP
jgi:Zn-dependent protease